MNFQLVLFDLDNTLLRTDVLEEFRGQAGLAPGPNYVQNLMAKLPQVHRLYDYDTLLAIHKKYPELKFGVFTRSPRVYTQTLLQTFYPHLKWDAVVSFEDVRETKPHPDGIWKAMQQLKLNDPTRVVLVGDGPTDIMAAYRAGVWAFLDRTSWGNFHSKSDWASLALIADNVLSNTGQLINALEQPNSGLPLLERVTTTGDATGFARLPEIYHKDYWAADQKAVAIQVLGRRFKSCLEFQYRSPWHPVSQQILDLKDAVVFPEAWITSLRRAIASQMRCVVGTNNVITVIPAKPARPPRLERLVAQLAASHEAQPIIKTKMLFGNGNDPNKLVFVPNQLLYLPGAKSHNKDHLNAEERMQNVRDHLRVNEAISVKGKHVVVIDDVTTSGASLFHAYYKLMDAGAALVTPISMTQAISPQ